MKAEPIKVDAFYAAGWVPVLTLGDAQFSQSLADPEVWQRVRTMPDGSKQYRFCWDGDAKVVPTLGQVTDAINAEIVSRVSAGDDEEARDD